MNKNFTKYQIATAIAVLFHIIGIIGILYFDNKFLVQASPLNLLLMFALLIWTQTEKNFSFLLFFLAVFFMGIAVEIVGVNTGSFFGDYTYGNTMGYKFKGVPLLIGINWFLIIYCCGISIHTLLMKAINHISTDTGTKPMALKALSVIIDGATLAVFFDWVMEPVAIKLHYWNWGGNGSAPVYNYLCWLIVSIGFLVIFHFSKFEKRNKFAVNLLLIQLMFFLLLRTFMT